MKQCPKWQECGVEGCPHYGEHDEQCMCGRHTFCTAVSQMIKCIEIVDSVPVVERKDASA